MAIPKVVVTPTGFKLGSKGRVIKSDPDTVRSFYQQNDKGTNRKIRQGLREAGLARLAAISR